MRQKAWRRKELVKKGLSVEVLVVGGRWLRANRRRRTNPSMSWEQQKLGV